MFITEKQLFQYQNNIHSEYFNKAMARIAIEEFIKFSNFNTQESENIIGWFSYFLNKRVSKDIWKFIFKDDSLLIVKFEKSKNEKIYKFEVVLPPNNYDDLFK